MLFNSPYEQYSKYNGKKCNVIKKIDKPDNHHDLEVLPMYLIQFDNGKQIETWPEEIGK